MAKDLNNMGRFSEADSIYRLLLEREELDPHLVPSVKCGYALLQVTFQGGSHEKSRNYYGQR